METQASIVQEKAKAVIMFRDFDKDIGLKFTLANLSERVTKESIYELAKAIEVVLGPRRKITEINEEITNFIYKYTN